jgi:hypothetical protein
MATVHDEIRQDESTAMAKDPAAFGWAVERQAAR